MGGRIPKPSEVQTRFEQLVNKALAAKSYDELGDISRGNVLSQATHARQLLGRIVMALHRAEPIVAEALTTTLVEIGRDLSPPTGTRRLHIRNTARRRHRRRTR